MKQFIEKSRLPAEETVKNCTFDIFCNYLGEEKTNFASSVGR